MKEAKQEARRNQLDDKVIAGFVQRIEAKLDEMASEQGAYMKKCATIREEIKSIEEQAKDAGLTKKAVKTVVNLRKLDRKRESLREDLDGDDADNFDLIMKSLGQLADTPLGKAATNQATVQ